MGCNGQFHCNPIYTRHAYGPVRNQRLPLPAVGSIFVVYPRRCCHSVDTRFLLKPSAARWLRAPLTKRESRSCSVTSLLLLLFAHSLTYVKQTPLH